MPADHEPLVRLVRDAHGALQDLTAAGVPVEHLPGGPRPAGRPVRLYVSSDLLALTGSSPSN